MKKCIGSMGRDAISGRKWISSMVALLLVFSVNARAQSPPVVRHVPPGQLRVSKMKLLAPGVGWALSLGRLYWTEDNGATWKDITPPRPARSEEQICDVFFLDVRHAWALFAETSYRNPEPKFALAYSTDTGETWSRVAVHLPEPLNAGNGPHGTLAFADERHGWMVLHGSAAAFVSGALLVTSDGGRTWHAPPGEAPGGEGPILLVTPEEGWMVGTGDDFDLYVTRDSAKTWQKVSLPTPKEIYPATYPTCDVPVFEDKKRGFVVVTYSGGDRSAAVLFATRDGGRTWKADRTLTNMEPEGLGHRVPSAVVDSFWIVTKMSDHQPTLTIVGPGAKVRAADYALLHGGYFRANQLNFATPSNGWVIAGDAGLLSTVDGGTTWEDITPGPKLGALPLDNMVRDAAIAESRMPNAFSAQPGRNYSQKLGFDKSFVESTDNMLQWWIGSPFYDVGFYPNGAANKTPDPNLKSAWITTVAGEGWGLWATWVGLQSSCACYRGRGTFPRCLYQKRKYLSFSLDPEEAESDGYLEGALAAMNTTSLGLGGTIIYKDLENYNDTNSKKGDFRNCNTAAVFFLLGWIQAVRDSGFEAGVYESASNAADLSVVQADDIWVNRSDNAVTTWDPKFHPQVADDAFTNHQRMHQYTIDQENIEFGGASFDKIDADIVDAPVFAGAGVKNYGFVQDAPFLLGGSNSIENVPNAINDLGMAAGFWTEAYPDPTFPDIWDTVQHGFYYNTINEDFTSVDCSEPVHDNQGHYTELGGINNLGCAVGFTDLGAFVYDTTVKGGACPGKPPTRSCSTLLSCPGCAATTINDAGWIGGCTANPQPQGFVYKNGQFLMLSKGMESCITGINGQGTVVGYWSTDDTNFYGFVADASGSTINILTDQYSCPTDSPYTFLQGINSNGQVVGWSSGPSFGGGFWINGGACDLLSMGFGFSGEDGWTYSLNDYAQIVGETFTGPPVDGFSTNYGFILLPH